LPEVEGEASAKQKFKPYPIGYFQSTEPRSSPSSNYMRKWLARPRVTSGVGCSTPFPTRSTRCSQTTGPTSQRQAIRALGAPDIKAALDAGELVWAHAFEYACAQNDIDHRLTKPKHPWTNGPVERMNRTIKDATVKRYFYETHDQLRTHLRDFVDAYNFARRLKTLRGLTPYEFICKAWTSKPQRFKLSPLQQMPGLNS
jgi:hypothetical protein